MAVDFSRPVSTGGVYGPDGVRRNEYSLGERPRIRGDAGSTPVPVPFVDFIEVSTPVRFYGQGY
jgi:hypothetical protein